MFRSHLNIVKAKKKKSVIDKQTRKTLFNTIAIKEKRPELRLNAPPLKQRGGGSF